jgi:hypothetical protein
MSDKIKTAGIVAVSASAIVASSVYVYSNVVKDNKLSSDKNAATADTASTKITPTVSIRYKDGTFTGKGDYLTNNGVISHKMEVSVTLANGVVTAATTELKDDKVSDYSKKSQQKFNDELKVQVVGKKLDEVQTVTKIAGSSDTTKGFQAGVAEIKVLATY